jgi:hypothetical protein
VYRAIEAELWGVHEDLMVTDELVITSAAGAYGTLFEITARPPMTFCRLVDCLTQFLPPSARMKFFDGVDDECRGALVIHYWTEARSRVNASANSGASVRKSTQ